MVGADMNAMVPSVTQEQALELLELGFRHVDVCATTVTELDLLAAELPLDQPVVVRGDTAELSRLATLTLSRLGIDAVDAGPVAVGHRLVA